jgi:hypothetical protein
MTRLVVVVVSLLLFLACPATVPPKPASDGGDTVDAGFATSSRVALRWKRHRTLQNDLAHALSLDPDELCVEAGGRACATTGPVLLTEVLAAGGIANPLAVCSFLQNSRTCNDGPMLELQTPKGVHVGALGGNEPFLGESFTPLSEPILTTPLAVDRYVLSACGVRAERDSRGPAVVFSGVDLSASLTASAPGVRDMVKRLVQRLLARDANEAEVDAIVSMLDGSGLPGAQFAQLSCFAIATSTEFLFQ